MATSCLRFTVRLATVESVYWTGTVGIIFYLLNPQTVQFKGRKIMAVISCFCMYCKEFALEDEHLPKTAITFISWVNSLKDTHTVTQSQKEKEKFHSYPIRVIASLH